MDANARSGMHLFRRFLHWLVTRLPMLVVVGLAGRAWHAWRQHRRDATIRRRVEREVLPSIHSRYPEATKAPRRRVGLRSVPLDRIVGTMRNPSQNTADFLPLPGLRGQNWLGRWQRVTTAMDRLVTLPPVDLVQVGDEYYVEDGHNRVAAALKAGAVEIDADVTQLVIPGVETRPSTLSTSLAGEEDVRLAGQGRLSRTTPVRPASDYVSRQDLARNLDEERG